MKPRIPPETFQTARLLLRRPAAIDAAEIFQRWTQDPDVTRYLTWRPHTSLTESEAHISRCQASWEEGSAFVWFIEDRESGELVGSIASRVNQRGVNLGYLLARDAWGKGLMVEALTPIVEFWLSQPDVFRIWATCDVGNRGSQRVLEKAGLELEGTLRRWDNFPNLSPNPRDARCYSRVRA